MILGAVTPLLIQQAHFFTVDTPPRLYHPHAWAAARANPPRPRPRGDLALGGARWAWRPRAR